MSEYDYSLDFRVTLCLGRGDGGDVIVSVGVTEQEYEDLKESGGEVYGGTELYERIKEAAKDENEACLKSMGSDEEIDYDCISYMIELIDDIPDDEPSIEWDDYYDYPFAMEVVNGEIISMTADFQRALIDKILNTLNIPEEKFASFLLSLAEDGPDDEETDDEDLRSLIASLGYDALADILGFDEEKKTFDPDGIGFLNSTHGWEAKELLEALDFDLEKNVEYGPHGHGENGIIYIEED